MHRLPQPVFADRVLNSYSCEDHFYERDTEDHCWELLAAIVADSLSDHTIMQCGVNNSDRKDVKYPHLAGDIERWRREDPGLVSYEVVTLGKIVIDVGMPVTHCGARYNCRVIIYDGRVWLIRPKMALADDGNYREPRWFAAWLT